MKRETLEFPFHLSIDKISKKKRKDQTHIWFLFSIRLFCFFFLSTIVWEIGGLDANKITTVYIGSRTNQPGMLLTRVDKVQCSNKFDSVCMRVCSILPLVFFYVLVRYFQIKHFSVHSSTIKLTHQVNWYDFWHTAEKLPRWAQGILYCAEIMPNTFILWARCKTWW